MSKSKDETVAKQPTKKARVQEMLSAGAVSVGEIAEALSISKQAAYSLIGDVKRSGVAITGTLVEGCDALFDREGKAHQGQSSRLRQRR
ncbi:hypothetical protein FKO01_08635 [Mesorhizobium sp. B2-3-3]|nr:hypothetical protein FKO01_08635 [Mesorhizobium sp. B2-3-3]